MKGDIVLDARMLTSSGIGTYIQNILKGLSPFLPIIAVGDEKALKNFPHLKDIIPCNAPIYSLQEQIVLPRLIPLCALFWSPHYNVPLLPIRAKKRLVSLHDVYHLAFSSTLSTAQKAYAKIVIKQAVKRASGIITCSSFSRSEIGRFFPGVLAKTQVIPYGVDKTLFALHKSNLNLPKRFILSVGNLKPHKNLITLVKSLEYHDLSLVIVGAKEGLRTYDQALFEYIKKRPHLAERIIFTGYVESLAAYYSAASVFVFPSLYEGFGFPALEAMACGCPVAVSTSASLPEVAGDAAAYFDPLSPLNLADSVKKIVQNEVYRTELIAKGYRRASELNWEACCENHRNYITQLL